MRNSVKVVIDAYNGNVTFYVFDPADPILAAYRRIFPTLFTRRIRHARRPRIATSATRNRSSSSSPRYTASTT